MSPLIADKLPSLKVVGKPLTVVLSNDLVNLLSEQLYQSPLKAIEELVVNSYDANANKCKVFVPPSSDLESNFIVVYDDGEGMDYEGLVNLWHIGGSKKREEELSKKLKRKQIGKFGIGKLAAKTIAYKLTYISCNKGKVLTVSIDFRDFSKKGTETEESPYSQIIANVHEIEKWEDFSSNSALTKILSSCGVTPKELSRLKDNSWTLALLEDLTEKARKIKLETLRWVLSTAMPLRSDFNLFLNGEKVLSSKEGYEKVIEFNLNQLPEARLKSLEKATGEKWLIEGEFIKSDSFPSGIKGGVFVTGPVLTGGKSDDIVRSNGFFIRVRDRLVNDTDSLFGLTALVFGTFSRFRADIFADDLDVDLKASRETIEDSSKKAKFKTFLREVFNHANTAYENKMAEGDDKGKKEGERNQVSPRLVEYPVADVLTENMNSLAGAEADESWFYLSFNKESSIEKLTESLYAPKRKKYKYEFIGNGKSSRLVKFDPEKATFWINQDHEFVIAYLNDGVSRYLLQDVVTAEALLEVYLRENQVPISVVGRILEQRDELLRSLAKDRSYSFESIAERLRDSASDKYELEISLVVAARSLGFTAKHIAGSHYPDGLAVFTDYQTEEKKITLEAKSSKDVPSLGAIDFGGLQEHVLNEKADGCLLISPSYPGDSKDDYAAARRADNLKISCWTVEQLAKFVELSEKRQLTAKHLLQIVQSAYKPEDVTARLEALFSEPRWNQNSLYLGIVRALRQLDGRLKTSLRTVRMVATEVSRETEFMNIDEEVIERAISDLAGASQGAMILRGENIILQVSVSELERRLISVIKNPKEPRRLSSFRQEDE